MIIDRGNRSTLGKPASSAVLSTTTPALYPGANPGRRGVKPASNRLSHARSLYESEMGLKKYHYMGVYF
jgi:hypothetical protein